MDEAKKWTNLSCADIGALLAEKGFKVSRNIVAKNIVDRLEVALGRNFHPELSGVIPNGHTSGFEALNIARKILSNDEMPACIVCGVDSYIRARSLLWLDQHFRLKTEENSDGVIPGEAAAAVLVCANKNEGSATSARLTGLGFGYELASVMIEKPLLGLGLTEASKVALSEAGIQMHEIAFRLSDITGESYDFREQALVMAKLLRVHREESYPIWHCAENLGDTGAASGIIQLIVTCQSFQKGYAPAEIAMCFTSSNSGSRAVALLASNQSKILVT